MSNTPSKDEHGFSNNEIFNELVTEAPNTTTSDNDIGSNPQLGGDRKQPILTEQTSANVFSDSDLFDAYDQEAKHEHARAITSILKNFDSSYQAKVLFQSNNRNVLFWSLICVVGLFSLAIIVVVIYTLFASKQFSYADVASIITVLVSLVVSVLELVKIIVQYCFPDKDEEYIVKIVESIQNNDLERFKELNRTTESRYMRAKPKDESSS